MSNFALYSKYYDLFYKDKDYNAEADYVYRSLKQDHPALKSVLEFGSGTGEHGLQLLKKGLEVYGLERSSDMVAVAKGRNFPCQVADIAYFDLNTKFDAVISLFHVVSYLASNDQLISCFSNAYRHLKPSGVFLFDVWYTPAVYHQKPECRIKTASTDEIEVVRFAEPVIHSSENLVVVNYTVWITDKATGLTSTFKEAHTMRHFSVPEMDLLANMTGFRIEKVEEFGTGKEVSEKTWGACFILRKN